jgi:predicted signal transduction protein with EAL and GGDEF domain
VPARLGHGRAPGGDEFGILPTGPTDLVGAASVAWKIEQALEEDFLVEGHVIRVRASVGIALLPDHGDNVHDLLRRADLAMYDAKRSGGGFAVFAVEQEEAPARRLALLNDLRHCVEREELVLHYQPKIDLATRTAVGVEALVRWNHPVRGLLMPGAFMPELENNDLMISITDWVISEALRTLRAWRDEGYDLTMAVNLGARCLGAGTGLFETVDELTETWGIPADKLTFELTRARCSTRPCPACSSACRTWTSGCRSTTSGRATRRWSTCSACPVVEIKADRSFVSSLATVEDDAVIVRAIIDLAHNLGVTVVAEGVEDERTMELLVEYGCDAAQGYFFSRPVPKAELVRWLAGRRSAWRAASRGAAAVLAATAPG